MKGLNVFTISGPQQSVNPMTAPQTQGLNELNGLACDWHDAIALQREGQRDWCGKLLNTLVKTGMNEWVGECRYDRCDRSETSYTHQDTMIELNNLWQLVMDELMRTRNEQVHKSEADRWGREGLKNLNKWMMIVVLVAAFFTGFRSVNRVVLLTGGTEDYVLSSRQKSCRLLHNH